MPRDYDATAKALIAGAEKAVAAAVAPLLKRIEELESRQPEKGEKGERGDPGQAGSDGRDGIGQAAALIDRDGQLVITTTDGQVHKLGHVVGRDGKDGIDGKDGAAGTDGRDGRDGEAGERGERAIRVNPAAMARTPTPARPAAFTIRPPTIWRAMLSRSTVLPSWRNVTSLANVPVTAGCS